LPVASSFSELRLLLALFLFLSIDSALQPVTPPPREPDVGNFTFPVQGQKFVANAFCGFLWFPFNVSKTIIEYHRSIAVLAVDPVAAVAFVPPGIHGSYDLECSLSFPTSHPSTLGMKEYEGAQVRADCGEKLFRREHVCTWKGQRCSNLETKSHHELLISTATPDSCSNVSYDML